MERRGDHSLTESTLNAGSADPRAYHVSVQDRPDRPNQRPSFY